MLPIPLLKLGRHFLDKRGGIKELAVLSYPIDNSDGTSNTVSYVNSLAILFDDGQLNITGYNRFGECRTGDLDTINYPNEAAWNVDHVWRADRAFVIRTFDNKFFLYWLHSWSYRIGGSRWKRCLCQRVDTFAGTDRNRVAFGHPS